MPGRVIAVCAAAGFVALLIYGLSFDVRGWFEERRRAVELRKRDLLALREARLEVQRVTEEIGWIADAMAEIRDLPTAAGR